MATRFEWAHASGGFSLIGPEELEELAPDGNEAREWGLEFSTGSNGCMIYGSLEDLHSLAVGIGLRIEQVQRDNGLIVGTDANPSKEQAVSANPAHSFQPGSAMLTPGNEVRELCPQNPEHYLDSHAPGGAWYGRGHGEEPSPWPKNDLTDAANTESDDYNPVSKPKHYTMFSITPLDAIEEWGLGFCLGNSVKYIARAKHKDPAKEIEDLEKAAWYLNHEIERLKKVAADKE